MRAWLSERKGSGGVQVLPGQLAGWATKTRRGQGLDSNYGRRKRAGAAILKRVRACFRPVVAITAEVAIKAAGNAAIRDDCRPRFDGVRSVVSAFSGQATAS